MECPEINSSLVLNYRFIEIEDGWNSARLHLNDEIADIAYSKLEWITYGSEQLDLGKLFRFLSDNSPFNWQ